jgi:biopolymer transport protein ExbD
MQCKRKPIRDSDVNVTSFSDIAFLLIIFFILTTTFVRVAGSRMAIPAGASNPSKTEEKQLTVNLKAGEIRWGEESRQLTLPELRQTLTKENLLAKTPDKRIIIVDSAPEVPYEEYFQVVTAIARAGGVIAIVDQEEEAKGGAQ